MKEIFKDITGYEGLYQVSNLGNVKSLERKYVANNIVLKPNTNNSGYKYVILCKCKLKKTANIHRLVALTFLINHKNKDCVNHKNGDKLDNNCNNLEWVSYKENINHAFKTGLRKDVSENHWNNKLSKIDVIEIRKLILSKHTQREIAEKYNINQSTVSDIKRKKIRNYE